MCGRSRPTASDRTRSTSTSRDCGGSSSAHELASRPCGASGTGCCPRDAERMKTTVPLRPALRVAAAATLAVALCYVVIVAGILALVSTRLLHETDTRLKELLGQTRDVPVSQL